ncbi:putative quinol monooxygenase [Streptomyces sp. NPDC050560]|uniref:putative quinol monooxygenase n=1 Tax=Streptomyces sp. NPDC050560 TaxID=3365630 RepID=UPI0037A75705
MPSTAAPSVVLTAEARIRADRRAEFLAAATALRTASRAEDGVIAFGFYEDPTEPGLFFFREEYRDQDAMDRHMALPHAQEYVRAQGGWLAEPATARLSATETVREFHIQPLT